MGWPRGGGVRLGQAASGRGPGRAGKNGPGGHRRRGDPAVPGCAGRCERQVPAGVIHGLAALAEPAAATPLGEALADPEREVRIAAGAGLAKLGNAAASESLLKAATTGPGWERVQQTKHCLVLAEKLAAAGNKPEAAGIYRQLRESRTDPAEKYIRDAADKALAALD